MANKTCTIEGCTRVEQLRRGLCKPHYRRLMQWGDPTFNLTAPRHLNAWERIEFHTWEVTPGPLDTPCWVFDHGTTSRRGYGAVRAEGKTLMAHRVSYEHHKGSIPEGALILHGCDNPPCINPDHLRAGTVKDNMQDTLDRGRHRPPVGEINGNAKLTDESVWHMLDRRASTDLSYSQLAKEFGVSLAATAFVIQGERWKHVYQEWRKANPDADLRTIR